MNDKKQNDLNGNHADRSGLGAVAVIRAEGRYIAEHGAICRYRR